jgi:hypothetical protein
MLINTPLPLIYLCMLANLLSTTVDWFSNKNRFFISSIVLLIVMFIILFTFNYINKKYLESGVKDLQNRLWYSKSDADLVISQYESNKGINAYITAIITLDLVLPIAYSLLFSIILTVELSYLENKFYIYHDIRSLPFFVMCIDFSENIAIVFLLKQYPNLNNKNVKIASALTTAKWIGIGLIIALIIVLGVINALN